MDASELFIDFDECNAEEQTQIQEIKLYDKKYDVQTIEFYKNMREKKYNIISHDKFNYEPEQAFKFEYMWDPYTGERKEKDIFGALYFDPDELIHFFYKRRLNLLWNEPKDENGGYYQGYFGNALGSGHDILIKGRGLHPELYLFRLPIDDCYLEEDCDLSIITMGPKLTDQEIEHIDFLAETYHKKNYYDTYRKKRPSLKKMKELYDMAINANIGEEKNKEAVNNLIIL